MSAKINPEYLFLYGSLMRDIGAMDMLSGTAYLRFVREDAVRGVLYDLGDYPGLITEETALPGKGLVAGEVYEVLSPKIWDILDPFEDYLPDDEEKSMYLRRPMALVRGQEQCPRQAWAYIFNQRLDGYREIPQGDWRKYWFEKLGHGAGD